MGKNKSRKRRRSSSSSSSADEAKFWRKQCKKMEKRLKMMNKGKGSSSDEEDYEFLDEEVVDETFEETQNQGVEDPNDSSGQQKIPEEILNVLGSTPIDISNLFELNPNLLEIWTNTLIKGLSAEVKENLTNRYPPLTNIPIMDAPIVNPEIIAAVTEATINRDKKIQSLQKQLSAALAALGRALSDLIKEELEGGRPASRLQVIHIISDACRLLLDIHNQQSLIRKNILASCLDLDLKKAITESSTDTLLFGKDLSEKVKEARLLKKAAEDIKQKKAPAKQTPRQHPTNFKVPLKQRQVGRPTVSGLNATRRPLPRINRNYTTRPESRKNHFKRQ